MERNNNKWSISKNYTRLHRWSARNKAPTGFSGSTEQWDSLAVDWDAKLTPPLNSEELEEFSYPSDGSSLGEFGDGRTGQGNGRSVAKRIVDCVRGFLGNPEVQSKAKDIVSDYGEAAARGAGIIVDDEKNGGTRVKKRGVMLAIFRPKKTAAKAAVGVGKKLNEDTEHLQRQAVHMAGEYAGRAMGSAEDYARQRYGDTAGNIVGRGTGYATAGAERAVGAGAEVARKKGARTLGRFAGKVLGI